MFDGRVFLQIVDDVPHIGWYSSWFFDVIDASVPQDWICTTNLNRVQLLLGPPFMAATEEHCGRMVDLDSEMVELFWKRVRSSEGGAVRHSLEHEDDDCFSEIPEEERVTDAAVARVVEPLLQDVRTTLGPDHDRVVVSNAQRLREFLPISLFEQQVVDDVQQEIHGDFIDTSWPACPSIHTTRSGIEMGLSGASRMSQS